MVTAVDVALDESTIPMTIDLEITVEDIADAMKYIIDTGWLGDDYIYARKMTSNVSTCEKTCIGFTTKRDFFDYVTKNNYYTIDENDPLIVAKRNYVRPNKDYIGYYDGNVFVELLDGTILSKNEWKQSKPKQLKKETNI